MIKKTLQFNILIVMSWGFFACSENLVPGTDAKQKVSKERTQPSDKDAQVERDSADERERADFPANVSGVYLACSFLPERQSSQTQEVGCRLNDERYIKVNPKSASEVWRWSADVPDGIDVTIKELNPENTWHAVIVYESARSLDRQTLHDSIVRLEVNDGDGKPQTWESRIQAALDGIQKKQHVRLVWDSIHRTDAPHTDVMKIGSMEILIDGRWELFEFDLMNQSVNVGPYAADLMLGTQADLFLMGASGGIFEYDFSVPNSYSTKPPYDAFVDDSDHKAGFVLNFDRPRSAQGVRFNGGKPIGDQEVSNGMVDRFHFEVSSDNKNWEVVKGSSVRLEDYRQAHDVVWNQIP